MDTSNDKRRPLPPWLPPGEWHAVIPMERGSWLVVNADTPLVGTMTVEGRWTQLRKDSTDWLAPLFGHVDQIWPNEGAEAGRDEIADHIYKFALTNETRKRIDEEYPNWRTHAPAQQRVLNYGHRFTYFARYLGLLEHDKDRDVWRRTAKKLKAIKESPEFALTPEEIVSLPRSRDAAPVSDLRLQIAALFDEFEERLCKLIGA